MSHHAHPLRAADLLGLISFDGDITENQAIPQRRLGRENGPPHAVGAALNRWLRRDHHTWVDMAGRHVDGIATARAVNDRGGAWEIEALVAAPDGEGDPQPDVLYRLLEQAVGGAQEAGVPVVLLRLRPDSPATEQARRAGFHLAYREQLWRGSGPLRPQATATADPPRGHTIRPLAAADRAAEFGLYGRAIPASGRQALAMTQREWEAVTDRRWTGRTGRGDTTALGVEEDGTLRAVLRYGLPARAPSTVHAELLLDPTLGGHGPQICRALLARVCAAHPDHDGWLALHPASDTASAAVLAEEPAAASESYLLFSARTQRTVHASLPERSRAAIPTGG